MDAGGFTEWILGMQRGMATGEGSEVPCGGCVACCTSGQLVPVEDDERAQLPQGGVRETPEGTVLAHHEDGRTCHFLVETRCTVYDRRPRACRIYDCRIFPATGLEPEDDKPSIRDAAQRWRFRYDADEDRRRHQAARTTAVTIRMQQLAGRPTSATQLAAQAILHHHELL